MFRILRAIIALCRGVATSLLHYPAVNICFPTLCFGKLVLRNRHGRITVGKGCRLYGRVIVNLGTKLSPGNASIGERLIAEEQSTIAPRGGSIIIGNNLFLGACSILQTTVNSTLVIGNNVMIAAGVGIFACNHNFGDPLLPMCDQGETGKGITLGNDIWIGANAVILDGCVIGDGCIIGAGAVVKGHWPKGTIICGNPARAVKARSADSVNN